MSLKQQQQQGSSTASAFYATLARGLDDLDRSLASSAFLSLPSLRAALALLRGAHGGLARLVASLHLPGGAAWLDEYMDEASRLCDACRALRHGAAAVEGYAASAAQLASLLLLQQPSGSRQVARAVNACRREAAALKEENRALVEARADALALRLGEGVPADGAKLGGFNGFRGVLCATRMLTSFLLTILSWAVLHYPRPVLDAGPGAGAAGDCAAYFGPAFASALARAQQRAASQAAAAGGAGVMMTSSGARGRPWRRPRTPWTGAATWRRRPRRWARARGSCGPGARTSWRSLTTSSTRSSRPGRSCSTSAAAAATDLHRATPRHDERPA